MEEKLKQYGDRAMALDENGKVMQKVATLVTGTDIVLPVDIQGTTLKSSFVAFSGISIRDTAKNWIATNQDWSKYKRTVFRVDNTCDQPVTLFLSQQGIGDFNKLDGTREEIIIPANTERILLTPNEWAILGETIAETIAIGAVCTVAPTSGSIKVEAYFVPLS